MGGGAGFLHSRPFVFLSQMRRGSRRIWVGGAKSRDLSNFEIELLCLLSDIAAVSVEQCRSRYDDMNRRSHMSERLFSAQFITADCTKVNAYILDLVTVQQVFKGLYGCRKFCLRSWTTTN